MQKLVLIYLSTASLTYRCYEAVDNTLVIRCLLLQCRECGINTVQAFPWDERGCVELLTQIGQSELGKREEE